MSSNTRKPEMTKELLVRAGLRQLGDESGQEFASSLLSGRTPVPPLWLTSEQRTFVELDPHSTLTPEMRAAGADLVIKVISLCDLTSRTIDTFVRRNALDAEERAILLRGNAVAQALFQTCPSWPPARPKQLDEQTRAAVSRALLEEVANRLTTAPGEITLLRPQERPADGLDFADKVMTLATSSDEVQRRHDRFEWGQVKRGLVTKFAWVVSGLLGTVILAPLFVVLFLALRHYLPGLTFNQDMTIVGTAISLPLGGTGIGAAAQALKARWGRDRPGAGSPAGEPDPPRTDH